VFAKQAQKKRNFKNVPLQVTETMKETAKSKLINNESQSRTYGNRRLAEWWVRWLIEHLCF
jgi:hypothetical protein